MPDLHQTNTQLLYKIKRRIRLGPPLEMFYFYGYIFIRQAIRSLLIGAPLNRENSRRPLQEIAPALLPAHQPARRGDTRALGFDMRMRAQHLLHDVLLTTIDIDQQQVFAGAQGILKPAELRVGYL